MGLTRHCNGRRILSHLVAKNKYPKRRTIFLVFLLSTFIGYITYFSPLPFNQEVWNSKNNDRIDSFKIKHRMTDGLLMMDSLIGMDSEWLVLKVDDTDSIIEASLVSD